MHQPQIPLRPIRTQKVALSGSAAKIANAIAKGVHVVRVVSTEPAYLKLVDVNRVRIETAEADYPVTLGAPQHGLADRTAVVIAGAQGMAGINGSFRVAATSPDHLALLSATQRSISAATAADPVVITSNGHGYSDGDLVYIAGVQGMTELNGRFFEVDSATENTFELLDEDGTGHGSYSEGGVAIEAVDGEAFDEYTGGGEIVTESPGATDADLYLPEEQPEYLAVSPGQYVSALQGATGGNLFVTEMSK